MEGEKINILFFGSSKHNFFAWNIDVKKLASKFFIDFVNAVFAPLSCFFRHNSAHTLVWSGTTPVIIFSLNALPLNPLSLNMGRQ